MSDGFGAPRKRAEAPPPADQQRRRVLIPTLITLAVLLFVGAVFTGVWTDRLWFKSVGFSSVFSTMITTRVTLFIVMGLFFSAIVVVNVVIAYRTRPLTIAQMNPNDPVVRYRQSIDPLRKPALGALAVLLFVFAGSAAAGQWRMFLLWRNGQPFGQKDVYFNKDIGFYVFDYPWFRFVLSFAFAILIVSGIAVALVHYVYGGIALQTRSRRIARSAQIHLSVLVGVGMLLKALAYWLDRFELVIGSGGLIDGITFTDANARIPSKNILMIIAIICALLFFANIFRRSLLLPGISLGLLALTAILIGGIWPAVMQSFQVNPSEPDKEGPYIEKNIKATREAFNVSGVEKQSYTGKTELTPSELTESAESRVSTRLLDPTLVAPAFEQLQQVRGYYTVPETLDVDRYKLPGNEQPQDIVIAARELNLNGLQDSQRNWANDHTVYTHGYGVIAARGNQRGSQGQPVWVEKDIPPTGDLEVKEEPRIYFGENSPDYSIVGRPSGANPIEVDIPRGGSSEADTDEGTDGAASATQNTYDGKGGVPVGNLFNKMLYAVKFSEPNIVLSGRVNSASKILYDRHPRDRVNKVAPWLTVDGDPYPAVVSGRVVWIVDAYTTSNSYPYAQKVSLDEATSDTLTGTGAQVRLPSDQVNYMRNSVKAVVDAADGTVDLYQWDTKDPVLKTWMKTFPGTVKKKSSVSEELKQHLRYPVDMFKVQREILSTYHVTEPQTFYEGGERWKVPEDPAGKDNSLQPPYYLSASRPGQEDPKFSLTSVYLPNSRQNLASYVSVNSEATDPDYGKMQILQLSSDTQVDGPSQVANQFQADTGVRDALLPFTQNSGTNVIYGNLLTLPVGDALLYVQPVYVRRNNEQGTYPVLQYVVASFGENVGYGRSLDEALRVALGLQDGNSADTGTGDGGGGSGGGDTGGDAGATNQSTASILNQAQKEYDAAQKALKDGDLAEYQKRISAMGDLIERATGSLKTPPTSSAPPPESPGN